MRTVFLGERSTVHHGSGLTGVSGWPASSFSAVDDHDDHDHDHDHDDHDDHDDHVWRRTSSASLSVGRRGSLGSSLGASSYTTAASSVPSVGDLPDDVPFARPSAWLELWDFVGCGSFRGFVAEDPMDGAGGGQTSLFAFFDASVLSRDLKRALMALIELADAALGCAHLVVCVDREGAAALPDAAATLLKGLQWAGFSLTTLDTWTGGTGVDVTSSRWIFMGMEL